MPSLPPKVWAELLYDGTWNNVSRDVRVTNGVTVTRGLSSESASVAEPAGGELTLDNRGRRYSPRDPSSVTFGAGRNTPIRYGYHVGSPWAEMEGGLTYSSLFVLDDPALDVVGDFDMRVEVALEDWSESQMLALRYVSTGDQRSWALEILNGIPTFLWSPDGLFASRITQAATEALEAFNGQRLALRVTLDIDNGAGGYELRFYTGRTVDDDEWSLLGNPIVGASTTSVHTGSAYMEVGAGFNFNSTPAGSSLNRLRGKAYALKLLDSGTVKVAMSTRAATPGGASFVDDTGLTWARGGNAILTNKHIRLSGEVPEWPASRDRSGNESRITINPAGVSRRMDAGNKPQDSALLRYIKALGPIECWPLTDGAETGGGKSLNGSQDMRLDLSAGTATPGWGEGFLADWIEPVVLLPSGSNGTLRGSTARASSAATGWSVDFFYNGKQDLDITIADFGDMTDADPRVGWTVGLDVSADQITLFSASVGDTSSSSALQATISTAGVFDGRLHHIRLTTAVSGANSLFTLYVDGTSKASGTAVGYASEAVYFVRPTWFYAAVTQDIPSIGYVTYWGAGAPSAAAVYSAATGFQGEKAGARIQRIATEAAYTASVAGESVYQRPMGIQGRKKLLELLNEASRTNFGYLLDARDRAEVVHRGQSTLWNQPPAFVLDFAAGLVKDYKYRDDDLLTENDVSIKREYGSVPSRQILESGELSVQDYPNGVGRYDREYTYSLYEDDDAAQTAYLRLHLGTYNGVRFTRLTLDLANPRVHAMIDDILRADCGDLIRLTNLPDEHGPDDVDVLINGYTEESDDEHWTITFVCVPGGPWTAGVVGSDTHGRADTGGSTLAAAVGATDTTLSVASSGALWVTGSAPTITDTFQRTVSSGWGTTDTGQAWTTTGGSSTDYSVTPEIGAVAVASVNVSRYCLLTQPAADWDQAVSMATDALAVGGSMYPALVARYLDGSNVYLCRVQFAPGGAITLSLRKRVTGTETQLASYTTTLTHQVGVPVRVRWQGAGSTLRARIWADGQTEPDAWHVSATDTSLTVAGQIGMRSILSIDNTNPLPVTIRWSNLAVSATPGEYPQDFPFDIRVGGEMSTVHVCTGASSPQTMTVVRSVNGVSKSHTSGQDIRLAHPVYVAL